MIGGHVELVGVVAQAVDAIDLEVIYQSTLQIARELTLNMLRTGYSTIIKESQDFTFAVFDGAGRLVAQGIPLTGVVTEFVWANPHVYVLFDVKDEKGAIVRSPAQLQARQNVNVVHRADNRLDWRSIQVN